MTVPPNLRFTGADVLTKTDAVIDKVVLAEQHDIPGQNATFWNGTSAPWCRARSKIEADNFMLLSAELYAQRFTDAELDQLIGFYSSGIGAKYFKERQSLDSDELALANGLERSDRAQGAGESARPR